MGKINASISLNAYKDANPSNNPSLNFFKWSRSAVGISMDRAISEEILLAPGESRSLFNGSRTLAQDNTTEYDLSLKSGSSTTYVLKHSGGTAPAFRTRRSIASDATTQVTVTQAANMTTIASTGGTNFAFISGGAIPGDEVKIGSLFNVLNQGKFKVLAVTATSITFENSQGAPEGPITLGVGFADQVKVYSAAGVQKQDKIRISGGFSLASQATYAVTDVEDDRLEFYSASALPEELGVQTQAINIYYAAKKLIYIESNQKLAITANGTQEASLQPFQEADGLQPAMYLKSSVVWSMSVQNEGTDMATVYLAAVE